ncbi:hypothetical protein [Pseudomonas pergaminensis]|uniref:hypothetical protein n=1 Tax=Pseudomonas pergaminensis TaxID=2853159 RepID=UPI0034D6EA3F
MKIQLDIYAEAIESRAYEIIKNSTKLQTYGHAKIANDLLQQAQILLSAMKELREISSNLPEN